MVYIEENWRTATADDQPALFVRTPGKLFREVGRFDTWQQAVSEAQSRRELLADGEHARYRIMFVKVEVEK